MLIDRDRSCLLVVDIQERLAPKMAAPEQVIENSGVLMKAAARLSVPILVSEQYPRGLGHSVAEIAALAPVEAVVEKIHFSCLADDGFARRYSALQRPQAVVTGIEAHVCVLQTVEQLLDADADVFVVADATSSRDARNHSAAMDRLRDAGARIATTEMVVFEWLGRAATPEFKELSALIK